MLYREANRVAVMVELLANGQVQVEVSQTLAGALIARADLHLVCGGALVTASSRAGRFEKLGHAQD